MIIIGHRGASTYEPENSLASFKKAVKMGVNGVECDVRLTKDKKLVVIHDDTIDRTTSGKGKVSAYTLRQLKKYGIPSLSEVLKIMKSSGLLILIEVKERGTEKKIIDEVKKKKMEKQAIIVSFFPDSIKKIKKLSSIKTGFIFADWDIHPFKTADDVKADWLIPQFRLITKGFVKSLHKKNLKVLAWTVNKKSRAKELSKLGVDGIATNSPDILKK